MSPKIDGFAPPSVVGAVVADGAGGAPAVLAFSVARACNFS
jgi:hypothetical protein